MAWQVPIIVKVIHAQEVSVIEMESLILIVWTIICSIYIVGYEVCVQVFLESVIIRALSVEHSEKQLEWWW